VQMREQSKVADQEPPDETKENESQREFRYYRSRDSRCLGLDLVST